MPAKIIVLTATILIYAKKSLTRILNCTILVTRVDFFLQETPMGMGMARQKMSCTGRT